MSEVERPADRPLEPLLTSPHGGLKSTARAGRVPPTLPQIWLGLVEQDRRRASAEGKTLKDARTSLLELVAEAEPVYDVPEAEAMEHVETVLRRDFPNADAGDGCPPDPASFLAKEPRNLTRLQTGFGSLDRATRGGIPTGVVTAILGAPHTGKTALASQFAIAAASQGYLVVILFKDEGRFAGCVRLGQQFGLDRTKLENQDVDEIARFHDALLERAIFVPDPDSEHWTLEAAVAWLEANSAGRPCLLVVDSIQSAYARCADGKRSLREEIESKMRLLESAAKRGLTVIVTSEMNRSGYRHRDEKENTRGIAAGAESRAIEYVSRVLLSLEGDTETVVTCKVEKNSPGGKRPLQRLKFDPVVASFQGIGEEDAEAIVEEAERAEKEGKRARIRDRIRKALHKHQELNSRCLEKEVGGNKELVTEVRDLMVEDGELVSRPEGRARCFSLPERGRAR